MSFEFDMMDRMRPFGERLVNERAERIEAGKNKLSFGIEYLDCIFRGIFQDDLVLVGASTGIGKTQIAALIATKNAQAGKRVHFFSLESDFKEIERRMKYEYLAHIYYTSEKGRHPRVPLNYVSWFRGEIGDALAELEDRVDAELTEKYKTMEVFYKPPGQYTVEEIQKQILALQDVTDLIVIDHLHFFDLTDENENRGMKHILMTLRELSGDIRKPIVLVAHLRKPDSRVKVLCPSIHDFHGSSDIAKIATKAVTLSPCHDREGLEKHILPTYVRATKHRTSGASTRFIGKIAFNDRLNCYEKEYFVGQLSYMEDSAEWITKTSDMPWWAKEPYAWVSPEVEKKKNDR